MFLVFFMSRLNASSVWDENIELQLFDFCEDFEFSKFEVVASKLDKLLRRKSSKVELLKSVKRLIAGYKDCPDVIQLVAEFLLEKFDVNFVKKFVEREVERLVKKYGISFELRMPWDHIGNRPFLRLYFYLGKLYLNSGELNNARKVFENLIWMNPDDNQGARWMLVEVYLLQKDYKSVLNLCEIYKNEYSSYLSVNCLLALLKLGKIREAEKMVKNVIKSHAITLEYLIDGKPENLGFEPEYFVPFGRSEGYLYFKEFYKYWSKKEIEFLKKYEKEIRKKANYWRKELKDELENLKAFSNI